MFTRETAVFIGDTHFGHANIIKYCQRPFATVSEMNELMARHLYEADAAGKSIIHLGDFAFKGRFALMPFKHPENHMMLFGNHDDAAMDYSHWFGTVLGHPKTWRTFQYDINFNGYRVVLSHAPLQTFKGDINIHGHVHNSPYINRQYMIEHDENLFLLGNSKYRNVSAEVVEYIPRSLDEVKLLPVPPAL